jgi:transposase
MKRDYYVYGLFAEEVCFYVGKGRENRKAEHFRDFRTRNKAVSPSMYYKLRSLQEKQITPYIKVFIENLTEEEALEHEKHIITKYKRKIDGGTLCNIALGGNQPPSLIELIKVKGKEEAKRISKQRGKSTEETTRKRNEKKIEQLQLLMSQNMMLKDIATTLQVTTSTLRAWSKKYNIPINYAGKEQKIKEHLKSLREVIRNTVPKTAKTYTVKTPEGNIVTTQKLVLFCKEHGLDYANLRRTYKGNAKQHKGYTIINQEEPNY